MLQEPYKPIPEWIQKANFIKTDAYLPLEKANVPQQIVREEERSREESRKKASLISHTVSELKEDGSD